MITHLYLTPTTVAEPTVALGTALPLPSALTEIAQAQWPRTLVGMYLSLDMSWKAIADAIGKEGGPALSFAEVRAIVHDHYPRYATPDAIFALNGDDIAVMAREGVSLTHIAFEYGLPPKRMKVLMRQHLPEVVVGEHSRAVRSAIRLARAGAPVNHEELVASIAAWMARQDDEVPPSPPMRDKVFKGKQVGRVIVKDGDTEVLNIAIIVDDAFWKLDRGPGFNSQILALCTRTTTNEYFIVINSYLRRLYHRAKTREIVTAVIAHEAGHVLAGHMARKSQRYPFFNDRPPEEWEELQRQMAFNEIPDRVYYEEVARAILKGATRDIEYEADRFAAGLVGPSLIIATHVLTAAEHPILGVRLEALNRVERHAREMTTPEYIPFGIWQLDFSYGMFTDEELEKANEETEADKSVTGKSEEHRIDEVVDDASPRK